MVKIGRTPSLIGALMTCAAATVGAQPVDAARLHPETAAAWERYVHDTEQRREREIAGGRRLASASRAGTVAVVEPMGTIEVPSGLVHHWRGRIFIPGVTLDDVLRHAHTAPRQSDVITSKVLEDRGDSLRLFMKLTRREIITVTYNTEHLVEFRTLGSGRAASRSVATRIAELRDANTPGEREKPIGDDLGLLWRLNAYWLYEEVEDGVWVECESLSLSRGIPFLLKPFASGTVARVARESMQRTLDTLRQQLRATASAPRPRPA